MRDGADRPVKFASPGLVRGAVALLLAAMSCGVARAETSCIEGRVTAGDGRPIVGATVRVQATDRPVRTGAGGAFGLSTAVSTGPVVVAAWHRGFYGAHSAIRPGADSVGLVLTPLPGHDNPDYEWASARGEEGCKQCHGEAIVPQWSANLHSQSATNPLVRTMYSGTDMRGAPETSLSYRHDFPGNPGNCASCHAPAAAVDTPYGVYLDEVTGVDSEGVHCDFCHKVRDARAPGPGMPGVLSLDLLRPAKSGRDVFFGPYDDTSQDNDSYLPLQGKSRFCAPCHSHESWGVPIYQSYPEWLRSSYRTAGVECQDCHYRPNGRQTVVAPGAPASPTRDPGRVPSHNLMGEDRSAFIASAVDVGLETKLSTDSVHVTVGVANTGAGHHFPTGHPMRNVLLVVRAVDRADRPLRLLNGDVLPKFAGDHAGRPGRFYAKVLEELPTNYPDRPGRAARLPAPQWVKTRIHSDTRIPANEVDTSHYEFATHGAEGVRVEARLIYRRAYQSFEETKGWDLPDLVLHEKSAAGLPAADARLSQHP